MVLSVFSLVVQDQAERIPDVPLWPVPSFVERNSSLLKRALESADIGDLEKRRGESLDGRVGLLTQKFEAMGEGTILDRVDVNLAEQLRDDFVIDGTDYRERVLHYFELYTYIEGLVADGTLNREQIPVIFGERTFGQIYKLGPVIDNIEQLALHAQRGGKKISIDDRNLRALVADNLFDDDAASLARAERRAAALNSRRAERAVVRADAMTESEKNAKIVEAWYGNSGGGGDAPLQIGHTDKSVKGRQTFWGRLLGRDHS